MATFDTTDATRLLEAETGARSVEPEIRASGQLAKLVTDGWIPRVVSGFQKTIANSFVTDQVIRPVVTRDEIRRRFKLCTEGFLIMRRDFNYAVPHILDELPNYLRCRLDGVQWDAVSKRNGWAGT